MRLLVLSQGSGGAEENRGCKGEGRGGGVVGVVR